MSFVGKLSNFRLADLLQMIATTGKTGKLSLTRRDHKGVIVVRQGKIIYAASTATPRETLGSALMCEGLLTEGRLKEALDLQHNERPDDRLGKILVEIGAVRREDLERVIARQLEKVITELVEWTTGFFRFDLLRLPEGGEVEVDAKDFLLQEGLGTDQVLLSIAVHLDELERDQGGASERADEPDGEAADPTGSLADHALSDLTSLRSVMQEIRSPEFTGELTARILDYARQIFRRSVLFTVHANSFEGMAGFGLESADGAARPVRELTVPYGQPSILREVAERGETHRGALPFLPLNRRLADLLGGGQPEEIAVVPLSVNGRVVLVLYGDNHPENEPIGSLAEIEVLALQIGLAMEKELLEKRVRELEVMQHLLHQG